MIHFDFVVDEIDADNILDILHGEVCRCREAWMHRSLAEGGGCPDPDDVEFKAYEAHAKYLEELIGKMTNKKVEESLDISAESGKV